MADPLSITASIFGIVTLGFQVAKGLYQIADGIGFAGEEVRLYAAEINEFSKLLTHIRAQILATPDIPFSSRSLIKDIVDICDKILQPFHRLQNTLESFFARFKQSPQKLKQFGFRVKWIFHDKRKLLFYLEALRNQHRILNTALDLANLQTLKDRTAQNIWWALKPRALFNSNSSSILQMSLETSMAAINISSNSSSGGSFSITSPNDGNFLPTSHGLSNLEGNIENTETPPQIENGLDTQSSTDLALSRGSSEGHGDQLSVHEIQLLEQQTDQDLDPDSGTTAVEVLEDTRFLLRKAKRLALEALHSSETESSGSLGTLPSFSHKDYTVGWVCTLPIEYAVAEGMLDEQHVALSRIENDSNTYTLGRISRHNVVLLCIPAGAMDTGVASTAISEMLRSFPNIRIRLLVGIGGGVPSVNLDIRLGDVVVGSPNSSSGGLILFNGSDRNIVETGTLETPPRELGNILSTLQARHIRRETEIPRYIADMLEANPAMRLSFSAPDPGGDLLFKVNYEHQDKGLRNCLGCDPSHVIPRPSYRGRPAIHYGPIGWTNSIVETSLARDYIASQKPVYSIEREAMGLINFFPCLVIRGIWNYSDSHWSTIWQRYAAATAAGYAKEILETLHAA